MTKYKIHKRVKRLNRHLSLNKKIQGSNTFTCSHTEKRRVVFGNSVLVLSPEISQTDIAVRISGPIGVVKHSKAIEIVASVLTKMPSKMISRLGYDLME